jgi:hypothetical protein
MKQRLVDWAYKGWKVVQVPTLLSKYDSDVYVAHYRRPAGSSCAPKRTEKDQTALSS